MPPKTHFMLVRWIEDEKIGVMPVSAVQKGNPVQVGAIVPVKWSAGKYYDAEILQLSGKYISSVY